MIPLVEEPKELVEEFGVYEYCYFKCGIQTKHWHTGTNKPVCIPCAQKHKVDELPKSSPLCKPKTKKKRIRK